jgi:SAM-dependent methyltransferase
MSSPSLSLGETCPCCAFPTAVVGIVLLFVVSKIFMFSFGGQKSEATGVKRIVLFIMKWISRLTFVIIALLAIFLGVLQQQPQLRAQFFAKMITMMTKSEHLLNERCSLLSPISGKVLEFGPGPGTNFKCMKGLPIESWTGVEPNTNFADVLVAEKEAQNLTFSTNTVWLKGGDVDVEPGIFDVVLGTHLLCSVGGPEVVLKQAARALKPGGTYYFLEHVAAPAETSNRYVQMLIAPFFYILGNGCEFRQVWSDILDSESLRGFNITLKHFEADMLKPLSPHIVGTAVKPMN